MLDRTYFSWIGGYGDEDPFYYRVQSPVIMVEFDHHAGVWLANAEPAKYHIHTVVRTPNGNDYGKDLLRQHYERSHQKGSTHLNPQNEHAGGGGDGHHSHHDASAPARSHEHDHGHNYEHEHGGHSLVHEH